ncbi:MAG: hypothetical protein AAGG55_10390 [Pseudomonadota bacterium]
MINSTILGGTLLLASLSLAAQTEDSELFKPAGPTGAAKQKVRGSLGHR